MAKSSSTRTSAALPRRRNAISEPPPRERPSHDDIARRAFELYLSRPPHESDADADWLRAESELQAR